MHNIKNDNAVRESLVSNQTSKTCEEEEAKVRAEQQELRKQMFINVQPYINQTVNMASKY